MAAPTPRAAFEAVFPSLRETMLDHAKKYNLPENALEWFSKVLK
jgi:farnesyl diphosphate synthase